MTRRHANKDEVIRLMREGWELVSYRGYYWLRYEAERIEVYSQTFSALMRRKLLERGGEGKWPSPQQWLLVVEEAEVNSE